MAAEYYCNYCSRKEGQEHTKQCVIGSGKVVRPRGGVPGLISSNPTRPEKGSPAEAFQRKGGH